MRVMCINAKPIEGHGNYNLNLLKEGEIYNVTHVHPDTGGYYIGVGRYQGNLIYWGFERFIECSEEPEEDYNINIKKLTDGNKRPSSEEDKGSDSNKPI